MSTEEQERDEGRSWDTARHSVRRLQSILIANASRLDTQFSNAAGSPWSAFVLPALHNLRQAVGLSDETPRTWSLPAEPGPEVTAVVDQFGQRFEREHANSWVGMEFVGDDDVPDLVLPWELLMRHHSPLTDASPPTSLVDCDRCGARVRVPAEDVAEWTRQHALEHASPPTSQSPEDQT